MSSGLSMVRSMVIGALLAVGLAACAPEGADAEGTSAAAISAVADCVPSSPSCRPCPPGQLCPMIACICTTPPGLSACPYIAACIQGYSWNDQTCSCQPSHP